LATVELPILPATSWLPNEEAQMEVTRELVVPADPDEVWDALTSPERLAEWFANEVELALVPGGEGVFRWASGEVRRALVESVYEGRALTMRWWDEETPSEATTVAIAVECVDAGTRVVVTETAGASGFALALELRFAALVHA
jgi:uncharacterized protein YndB with AHSA1/START domain